MGVITWSGYNWITEERWGKVHPEKSHWWYDPSCVQIDNGNLILSTKHNPATFPAIDPLGPKLEPTIGAGLVSCDTKFGHGVFTIEAKLPYGNNLWPAFWMWSWDGWPPEIDVLEGYSNESPNYWSGWWPFKYWNVQTNVFYTKNGVTAKAGAKHHHWKKKDPTQNFIKYSVEWRPKYIKWYYNGKKVRTLKKKSILKELNKTTMNVIINNGVTNGVDRNNPDESDFIIKSFTYTP